MSRIAGSTPCSSRIFENLQSEISILPNHNFTYPFFKHITVIGLGLMGGSLVKSIKRAIPEIKITGVDQPEVLEQAKDFLDEAYAPANLALALKNSDLVFIATPINQIKQYLPKVVSAVKDGALVTDLGSTKAEIVNTAKKLFGGEKYFIGGHPMTGSEKGGWQNADPFLFENAVYVLTEPTFAPKNLIERFIAFLRQLGAQVMFLDAEEHDAIAADVSHLPQLLAVTLTNFIARAGVDKEARLRLAAGGFRDMTRIAMSRYALWHDILLSNRSNVLASIDQLIDSLNKARDLLSKDELQKAFEQANHLRLRIPRDTRGFLQSTYDITVVAPDTPGIIFALSSALAKEKINIKDIEVLKIREGAGGTLRLAFDSEATRAQAMEILHRAGFNCSKRD